MNALSSYAQVGESDRVNFLGNIRLGQDVSIADLLSNYHAVLCTYGAAEDRVLGIPGESLTGVVSARDLVSLYNGAPDSDLSLAASSLDTDTVAIVGMGNVALDVARLILSPVDVLSKTDVSDTWLEMRARSRVKRVVVIGRRGPLNVSFTIKELREMIKLPSVQSVINPCDFEGVQEQLKSLERPRKRLTELLLKTMKSDQVSQDQAWELKLWRSPVSVLGEERVTGLELRDTRDSDVTERLECGLVVRSVGYSSVQADPQLPWNDNTRVISNEDGRARGCPGLYTAGWLGTGPRGVIIDTMNTAFRVAASLVTDLGSQQLTERPGLQGLSEAVRTGATSWADWQRLDTEELRRGEAKDKARDKIVRVQEMMEVIRSSR